MYYIYFGLGSGTAWLNQYVVVIERPSASAALDALCDWMEEHNDNHIIDLSEYEWDEDGNGNNLLHKGTNEVAYYDDEFITGGNHGIVVHHYGELIIRDLTQDEFEELTKDSSVVVVKGE